MTVARMPRRGLVPGLTAIGALALAICAVEAVIVGRIAAEGAWWTVAMAALFCAGAWCANRRPDALAARRYLLAGTVAIVWMAGGLGLAIAYRRLGDGSWLVAPDTAMVMLDVALPAAILGLFVVYPDGVVQRRYERRLARAAVALVVLVPLVLLVARPTLLPMLAFGWLTAYSGPVPDVASPLHAGGLSFLAGPAAFAVRSALGILIGLAAVLLFVRYRRSDAALRQRTRWPLVALSLAALQPPENALAATGLLPRVAVDLSVIATIVALAGALAVGLLRPALFDLDHVVRRTLVYVGLLGATGAACVAVAAAAGAAAGTLGMNLAIGVAIAVTLLAEPVRHAAARRVAGWAYGERVSGPELLRRLGDALEHTLEPAELARTLAATIREGLGVAWVRLELDDGPDAVAGTVEPVPAGAPTRVPLAYGSERLGVLEVAPTVLPLDPLVLGNLARQSALAMGNARLAAALRERAEQLAASRMRIVEAQETARRRLERDIHDGVQQELVALIAKIGLARGQLQRDPEAVAATLADLQGEVRQAIGDLRELASGIHPSVLGDRGIVEAIETRAARLPLGVTIECAPELRATRFPQAVEGAVYFVVCEGFANALKHSGAERVTVRLRADPTRLVLEVADDGRGFDPAVATHAGSGIGGLADRVDALGGRFAVEAAPGAGVRLRATFPTLAPRPQEVPPPTDEAVA